MGTGRKQAFWTNKELTEMAKDDTRRRTMISPADESLSYADQAERVRRISSAALVKLEYLLREAATPDEVAAVVRVLLDASKLAAQSIALPGIHPNKLSDDELDAALAKVSK